VELSEFRGKNVVLAFSPGAFTGVYTQEMCNFRDSSNKFAQLNAQVIGISVDPPFSQKAWSDQNGLNFPLLSDFSRQAVEAYGVALLNFAGMGGSVAAQRAVFSLDKEGTVRYKWVGSSPAVEPDYDEVQRELGKLD